MGRQTHSNFVRNYLPLLVGLTVGLVIYAQVGIGQVVKIDGVAPGDGIKAETLENTNFISAVRKLILGGAVGCMMATFLIVMSGMWPYVKLIGLFRHVSMVEGGLVSRREGRQWLELLELVGKWSYTDVFLVCLSQVIFRIFTENKSIGPMGAMGSLKIELWSELRLPSVALIVAIAMTSGLTHWVISEMWPWRTSRSTYLDFSTENTPLRDKYRVRFEGVDGEDDADEDVHRESRIFNRGALLAAVTGLLCLLLSMGFPFLTVYRGGFLGMLIAEDERNLSLSVFSLASMMCKSCFQKGGTWHSIFFAVTLVNMAFVAPLIEFVLLIAASVYALANRDDANNVCRSVAGWFHSFACADMLVITCILVVAVMPTLVKINMGDQCEAFAFLLENKRLLTVMNLGDAASDKCFQVHSRLEFGWFLLALSCALRVLVRVSWFFGGSIGTMYGTAGQTVEDITVLERPASMMERFRAYTLSDIRDVTGE